MRGFCNRGLCAGGVLISVHICTVPSGFYCLNFFKSGRFFFIFLVSRWSTLWIVCGPSTWQRLAIINNCSCQGSQQLLMSGFPASRKIRENQGKNFSSGKSGNFVESQGKSGNFALTEVLLDLRNNKKERWNQKGNVQRCREIPKRKSKETSEHTKGGGHPRPPYGGLKCPDRLEVV